MSIFQVRGLDHIVLRIADRPRALAFYVGVLGLTVERELPRIGLIQLRAGASLIDLVPADRGPGNASLPPNPNVDHFALEITPFDEQLLRAHFARHGVEVGETGQRYGAGGEGPSIYLSDPDGNKIELKGPAADRGQGPLRPAFGIVDVFASAPLTGNPLAVVDDADGLSDDTLRRIAGEFNQSETTFLFEPLRGGKRRLRSFTATGTEVFGAGHNALGAWLWLAQSGRLGPIGTGLDLTQEIGGRVLPLRIREVDGGIHVTLDQAPPRFLGVAADAAALAGALGLDPADLAAGPAPRVVSTGADHLLVGAVDAEAVDRATPDAARLLGVLRGIGAQGCYLFALQPPGSETIAYARFFNPTVGLWEDAATGSAAGPLAAYLVETGRAPAGTQILVEQGRKMGRPSRLAVQVDNGVVSLTGTGHTVAEGRLAALSRSGAAGHHAA